MLGAGATLAADWATSRSTLVLNKLVRKKDGEDSLNILIFNKLEYGMTMMILEGKTIHSQIGGSLFSPAIGKFHTVFMTVPFPCAVDTNCPITVPSVVSSAIRTAS